MIDYEYPDYLNIKYKIVEIDEAGQLMVVRYWTDWLTEEELASDSNRNPDGTPVRCRTDYSINVWDSLRNEKDIHDFIINTMPIDWFKLQYVVKNPNIDHTVNGRLSHIKDLLNKTFEKKIQIKVEQPSETTTNVSENLNNFYEALENAPSLTENELDNLLKKFVK